jgi:hypothetical protein
MKHLLLTTTAIFVLSTPAFASDKETYQANTKIEKSTNGNYSETNSVSKTDMDGTTNSSDKKLVVTVDDKGNTEKTRTTERVTDPKGMGNKHIVTTKDTESTKDDVVSTSHEKTVNGKNVEGTTDSYKTSSKMREDSKGNFAQKDITTKTDADGTTVSFEKNAKVEVEDNGETDKSTTTKKVTDPKGLNNKSTVKTSNTETIKDGMKETNQTVTVDGKTVRDTGTMSPTR